MHTGADLRYQKRRRFSAGHAQTLRHGRFKRNAKHRYHHAQSVLPRPESIQQRHSQKRLAHQPASGHCAKSAKPGAGPFSLTGQPNAMGGREVGGSGQLDLSAHRDMANPAHRAEVAALWGVKDRCPVKPGKTAVEMFQAAADGEIKALWIACTNPAQSMPDQALVRRAHGTLQKSSCVQEAFCDDRNLHSTQTCCCPPPPGAKRRHRHQQRTPH